MKIFKRVAVVSMTAILVAGCSTTPPTLSAAKPVPADRVYYHNSLIAANPAKIVVVKDEGALMALGYHQFFINGKVAASLRAGERVEFTVDPANYVLGILPVFSKSTQEQFLGGYAVTSLDQSVVAGKTYYYRVLVESDGPSRIQRFVPN